MPSPSPCPPLDPPPLLGIEIARQQKEHFRHRRWPFRKRPFLETEAGVSKPRRTRATPGTAGLSRNLPEGGHLVTGGGDGRVRRGEQPKRSRDPPLAAPDRLAQGDQGHQPEDGRDVGGGKGWRHHVLRGGRCDVQTPRVRPGRCRGAVVDGDRRPNGPRPSLSGDPGRSRGQGHAFPEGRRLTPPSPPGSSASASAASAACPDPLPAAG